MATKTTNNQTHLTLEERRIIEKGIYNGSTKSAIAQTLGKDNSTIGKEIKLHRVITTPCFLALPCKTYRSCKHNHNCKKGCPDYVEFYCSRRDRSPGACNGCKRITSCRFTKYKYSADKANDAYKDLLISSRIGIDQNVESMEMIAAIVVPLIKQGQSPYQIVQKHPELGICEKTLYNYIEGRYFADYGVLDIDLRRKVGRHISKTKRIEFKKREDRSYLNGRTFKDYLDYIKQNPNASIVLMDTVYNDIGNGPFIQTFKFMKDSVSLMLGIYHEAKTIDAMVNGLDLLNDVLGDELFDKYFEVILTDRGSEFLSPEQFETRANGTLRSRLFYCDPMASYQKGSLENNHEELRYILPKECNLYNLGLTSQAQLNIALSHINSAPKEKLEGKSPIELCGFLHPELMKKINDFGINLISPDEIILKPYLLKK